VTGLAAAERERALAPIRQYALALRDGDKLFGKTTQGIGDLDRAAGVFLGQLGIPAAFVQYMQYVTTEDGAMLGGNEAYRITIDPAGLIRDGSGYWSVIRTGR